MPPPAPKLPGYEGHRLSNKLGKYWNESNSDNPLDDYNKNHPTSASFLVNHGKERRAALAEEKSKIDRENLVNSKRNIAPPPVAPLPLLLLMMPQLAPLELKQQVTLSEARRKLTNLLFLYFLYSIQAKFLPQVLETETRFLYHYHHQAFLLLLSSLFIHLMMMLLLFYQVPIPF